MIFEELIQKDNAFAIAVRCIENLLDLSAEYDLKKSMGFSSLERREPALTDYQHAENIVERHLSRDRRHPLPTALINSFNDKTGSDLGEVQIVYGPGANGYARSRHALALAVLDTIYFRDGAYKPETEEGRKTIAHELTHVAQHRNRPPADNRTKGELEAEAEAAERTEEDCPPEMREIAVRGRKYRLTERQHRALMQQLRLEVEQELEWREATMRPEEYEPLLKAYSRREERGELPWQE